MHQLRDASKDFLWYSLALDESTDVQDTAQLLVFIRGINTRFELTEELLSVESLKDTTTGQDLFSAIVNCVERTGLAWNKIASVTTDGARALTGKNVGLVKLMNNKIKEEHPDHTLLPLHCVIHQESLCKAALNIKHVIDPVVSVINLIRARVLYHRQFKAMLEDLETEQSDIIYHSSVRWLSLGKILRRVCDLKEEIVMFLEMKGIDCDFVTNIVNEEWKSDFMFAIDIMEQLNELNVKLQGNSLFAHEMYVHVKSFQAKLSLFSSQAGERRFCHFPLLRQKTISGEMADRYKAQLDALVVEFERRFQDFKNLEPLFNILRSPFSAEADSAPEDIQLELLDLQADYDLKEKFKFGPFLGRVSFAQLTGSTDDDWVDRINHLWTVSLLLIFAILVSSSQFVGDPIHCWCPAEFTKAYTDYTKSYCWISNAYFIPMDDQIPKDIKTREDHELSYYQWIPLILLLMALLFKIPNIIWRMLNVSSGIHLERINQLTDSTQLGTPENRDQTVGHIARYIDRWLRNNREFHRNMLVKIKQRLSNVFIFCLGKREGHFLIGLYLFIKVLYCVNCIGQFFLLDVFLSNNYGTYGFEVLKSLSQNVELKESPRFPRVTLCDFEIRQMNNILRWTVQCVLPINLFNEKIFTFIWFWLFLVTILTFLNLFSWWYYVLFQKNKHQFVKKYLIVSNELKSGFEKKLARKFAAEYLRDDGIFVLRMIGKNSTAVILMDIIKELWRLYRDEPPGRRTNNVLETVSLRKEISNEGANNIIN